MSYSEIRALVRSEAVDEVAHQFGARQAKRAGVAKVVGWRERTVRKVALSALLLFAILAAPTGWAIRGEGAREVSETENAPQQVVAHVTWTPDQLRKNANRNLTYHVDLMAQHFCLCRKLGIKEAIPQAALYVTKNHDELLDACPSKAFVAASLLLASYSPIEVFEACEVHQSAVFPHPEVQDGYLARFGR
jgi:hypothetical protein